MDPVIETVERAVAGDPRVITKNGEPIAVVIGYDEWEHMKAEMERLKNKLWTHGDTCSSECTAACNEMHTYEPGCWFGPGLGERTHD